MEPTPITPSTQQVRRDAVGGKRGDGHRRTRRIRRADARTITVGRCDPTLTAYAGLAPFGAWMRAEGLDDDLHRLFFRLKSGRRVTAFPSAPCDPSETARACSTKRLDSNAQRSSKTSVGVHPPAEAKIMS
jgi:hypothetical protein